MDDPGEEDEDGLTQVIVGLMQKDRRKAKSQGEDYLTIGYMMYKVRSTNNSDYFGLCCTGYHTVKGIRLSHEVL